MQGISRTSHLCATILDFSLYKAIYVMRTLSEKPAEWFTRRDRGPSWPGDLDGHSAHHRLKDIDAALDQAR